MRDILRLIDKTLNRFTMYRVILYGLIILLIIADILAFAGKVGIGPVGLLVSIAILCVSCFAANWGISRLLRVAYNNESWLISALILACILPPTNGMHRALYVALAGVIAMASKYLIIYRGSHVFNPAAVAAFVLTITSLLPAIWWIATPWLAPFTAILALIVLRKQRKFSLFLVFAIVALMLNFYVGVALHSGGMSSVLSAALLSWPLVFMGSIMLTEPSTLPPTRYYQVLLGILVGGVFASSLHIGRLVATPETALIAGGIFTALAAPSFGAILRLKRITQLSSSIYDLAFELPSKHFSFTPGQYMEWTLPFAHADNRGNRRMFSIASSPEESEVRIGIRTYQPSSTFKSTLLGLKPGNPIRVAHVAGNFTLPTDPERPLLFIAGGIGITPFRSIIQHLVDTKQTRDMVLIYLATNQEDFVYKDVLQAAKVVGLRAHYIIGRLTADQLRELLPDVAKRDVYLSGPDAMVTAYKSLVSSFGVPLSRTHSDHFTGY